jgi:hypothetical protein
LIKLIDFVTPYTFQQEGDGIASYSRISTFSGGPRVVKIGSEQHKHLFCNTFTASHLKYEPKQLSWPKLNHADLDRLRGIPFWREALATEREAGAMVSAFAETVRDPMIREAIWLQGLEECRHGRLLEFLIQHYEIPLIEPSPVILPEKLETAFLDFGYGECLDSFFAFGMFGIARRTCYLPEALFEIFDPILHEEARHIIFFINWVSYKQVRQGRGSVLRGFNAIWHYSRAVRNLVQAFGGGGEKQEAQTFTASEASHFMDGLTPQLFLSTALEENAKRMSVFDPQLLQPHLSKRCSKVALRILSLLPQQSPLAKLHPSA